MKRIPPYLKNKYSVAFLVFFIWIMFFDRNRVINQFKLVGTLNGLKSEREYYQKHIENDSASLYILESDKEQLEKFAREKYLMKKDNEDIYLVIDNED